MSKIRFSKEEQERLRQLEIVESVTEKILRFTQDFKRFVISESKQGKTANEIFREAGIDISLFPKRYFYQQLKLWRHQDLNTKKKKGRPKKQEKSIEEMSIEELKAKVAYLELENDFLKKLKALEEGANIEDLY